MKQFLRNWVTRAGLAACAVAAAAAAQAQQYTLTDIGPVGDELLGAYGVNDSGQVVGSEAPVSGGDHFPFLWTAATGMQLLLNVNGSANAINRLGQVAGDANFGATDDAFMWSPATGAVDIGNLGGPATGSGINASGVVAGDSFLNPWGEHCFLWSASAGLQDLPGPTFFTSAWGINDSGAICGTEVSNAGAAAYIWTAAAGFHTLGTLGGSDSYAHAINGNGQVVGMSTVAGGNEHPFLWSASGGMVDLGTLGGPTGVANAINSSGVVVGQADDPSGQQHAFVWTVAGGIQDLNSLIPSGSGFVLSVAYGISDSGLIVGMAIRGSEYHAFLLSPSGMNTVLPEGCQIYRGRYGSGYLADLYASDDSRMNTFAGFVLSSSEAPVQMIITGTSPMQSPSQLRIQVEAKASTANIRQTIELWDFVAGAYVPVDSRPATTSDSVAEVTVTSPSRFVEPGTRTLKARLAWRATGPVLQFPWQAGVDRSVWLEQ